MALFNHVNAAAAALVKALRPKQIAKLCLGGFHSAMASLQPLDGWHGGQGLHERCIDVCSFDRQDLGRMSARARNLRAAIVPSSGARTAARRRRGGA